MRDWRQLRPLFGVLILFLCAACSSVQPGKHVNVTTIRIDHPKSPPIRPLQKLNPIWWLGNVDDPQPPDWYRPGTSGRQWRWQTRNPFHNFTFYVVGVSDKPATRTGRFPTEVFPAAGGWNWAIHRYRFILLPFVAFEGDWWKFYIGWRDTGNLGAKLNFGPWAKKRALQPAAATPSPPRTAAPHRSNRG